MKKVAIAFVVLFFGITNHINAMKKAEEISLAEEKPPQTLVKTPSLLEANIETEDYLKFLRTSQGRWKIAGHVFGVTENIFDAIAYAGVMFSQILPESSRSAFTYAMAAIGTGKLVCIKLREVANKTAKERAEEITSLKGQS